MFFFRAESSSYHPRKILASINTLAPSSNSAKVIFQLFVFRDPAERLLIERQGYPGILDDCYRSPLG
jgi:hypothetical protein